MRHIIFKNYVSVTTRHPFSVEIFLEMNKKILSLQSVAAMVYLKLCQQSNPNRPMAGRDDKTSVPHSDSPSL